MSILQTLEAEAAGNEVTLLVHGLCGLGYCPLAVTLLCSLMMENVNIQQHQCHCHTINRASNTLVVGSTTAVRKVAAKSHMSHLSSHFTRVQAT